jgi:hypothetical protein
MARLTLALLASLLVAVPLSRATTGPTQSVATMQEGLRLTARVQEASSPTTLRWHVALGQDETLTQLGNGSIAVVAPWPADPGDGTTYPPEDTHVMPPPPADDPYAKSADPDGSMAADEAMHDVGPFDPAYSDEYLPDTGHDAPNDPDSPANANSGPAPGPDTSGDTTDPSDNEVVPESDPTDAVYAAEESRNDQVIALIPAPRAKGGRAFFAIVAPDTVELTVGPSAHPLVVTADVIFNPDAFGDEVRVTPK